MEKKEFINQENEILDEVINIEDLESSSSITEEDSIDTMMQKVEAKTNNFHKVLRSSNPNVALN